jgi:hypothetical protein
MKRSLLFTVLCAATVLLLSAWPTSSARAQDNQGDDSCGGAIVAEDDNNQGDDNAQGDENGCGMVVVEVEDDQGEDVDDQGDDVDVEGSEMALSGVNQGTLLQVQTVQNGSFVLKGLPKGRLTLTVTRVHNGVTTTRTRKASTREGRTRRLRMRLRPAP